MPTYLARIRKDSGQTEQKILTVPAEDRLDEYLSRVDGFVLSCTLCEAEVSSPTRTVVTPTTRANRQARSRTADLVLFSWYLHTLVDAGVPLVRALNIVRRQIENEVWNRVIGEVVSSLERGESFSDSLKKYPRFFPRHFVHLVDVGEISGNLDEMLRQLALYGESQLETRAQIRAAIAYPAVLVSACTGVVIFLIAFVLPRIAKMFDNMDLALPGITAFLLQAGSVVRAQILPIVGLPILIAIVLPLVLRSPAGRYFLGRFALTAPLVGTLYRKIVLARFCRTLALLQSSGVSLLVSLEVSRKGLGNEPLERFLEEVETNLKEGAGLGEELARSKYVPEVVSSMISVGEETGSLTGMLEKVTRFYERDIAQTVRTLPKILEPAIIVAMTVVVGLIAASVFIPLSQLTHGIGQ